MQLSSTKLGIRSNFNRSEIEEICFCKKPSFGKVINFFVYEGKLLLLNVVAWYVNTFIEGRQDLRVELTLFTEIFS